MKRKFHWRSYVSFTLFTSFFLMTISGVILYIAPPGRISRWIDWIMMGFSRAQWEDLHTLSSYLFIVLGLVHLFSMNWSAFFSYLRSRVTKRMNRKRELIISLITFAIIFISTVAKLPPVYYVMDLGAIISEGWSEKHGSPPVPGAERLTVNDLAEQLFEADPEEVVSTLAELGYKVKDINDTLEDIARAHRTAPSEVFNKLAVYYTSSILIDNTGGRPD